MQIVKEIIPKELYSKDKGVWIVDMGENFTGTYKIKVNGSSGDTISFRFIDTPSTTSSTTYKIQGYAKAGSIRFYGNTRGGQIILEEIAQ